MALSTHFLERRNVSNKTTINLLIVVLVLLVISISCVGALWFLRRARRARRARRQAGLLPTQEFDEKLSAPSKKMGHRRVSGISIASTVSSLSSKRRSSTLDEEKQQFLTSISPPPNRALPQIRITFPEETDNEGKQRSGRVVVLHVDDKGGVGMEPVPEGEALPPYEEERFVSLDLQRIGGLKEKEYVPAQKETSA